LENPFGFSFFIVKENIEIINFLPKTTNVPIDYQDAMLRCFLFNLTERLKSVARATALEEKSGYNRYIII